MFEEAEGEAFIGVQEAANITGYHANYLQKLARAGNMPAHQRAPNAHYLFLVSELRAWLRGDWKPGDE